MPKTVQEINDKIGQGQAVVVTAEEMIDIVEEKGAAKAAEEVDVVTTGTFGPMCSSGAFLNIGHTKPRMKIQKAWINGVAAYCGLAAVDLYIGATELQEDDPANSVFPGEFAYGGGHLIEELIAGEDVQLIAKGYGTDCYPLRKLQTLVSLKTLNEAVLVNPRNSYQNYNVAVNAKKARPIYTYMGILRPRLGNANYCSAGQLSPLLNDPHYRTIGVGTRIFLGGAQGYVYWHGTQHHPVAERTEKGVVKSGAGTLAVTGDMKQMSPDFVRGVSFRGYGVSLAVGIGIPIPILDEEMARYTSVSDKDIYTKVIDYSSAYPDLEPEVLAEVNYAQLRSGKILLEGKQVPTASLSSFAKAREIAGTLKQWIQRGEFLLTDPVAPLPSAESGYAFKSLELRPFNGSREGRNHRRW